MDKYEGESLRVLLEQIESDPRDYLSLCSKRVNGVWYVWVEWECQLGTIQ